MQISIFNGFTLINGVSLHWGSSAMASISVSSSRAMDNTTYTVCEHYYV